jgi:putative ABC transport system permease protein
MWFLTIVLRNLWNRKVRTGLTCLGMGVAVCAVVTMIGVADVFEQAVAKLLEARGVDLVVTRAGVAQRVAASLPAALRERLLKVPAVKTVEPMLVDVVSFEDQNLVAVYVLGWDVAGRMFDELRFVSGRKPRAGDLRPAVIGASLAETLGKTVGEHIKIEDEDFTIVGINQSPNIFENSTAVVALSDLQDLMDRKDQVTAFLVILEDSSDKKAKVDVVRQEIEDLRDENGRKIGVSAMATEAHVKSSLELRVVQAMAFSTSAIALFIGVIGMLNTMMIAVFERTQEIGTLRAIGWPKLRVVRLILLESLFLSLLGWLLGMAGSLFLTKALSISPASSTVILPSAVSPAIMSKALLLAIVAGIVGASYPAVVAARLIPTEALRRD